MFSNALKSISATNITANYSVSPTQTSTAGPWKIYDAKKKSTGKQYSVFVFDKKSFDSHGSSLGRSGAASFKRSMEEVTERLKKEASSLAKLRHPSILELVEPVEETRGGGLQFVTEAVTASLASLLAEKDDQERAGGPGGRSSRYVTEDADGTRRRRELEIDELEIQKGLLQISKALEFLHENAGLVHGNLTPDAILINAKSDWKISGLAFCSPAEGSTKPTSIQPISLNEVLNMDPRLPKAVQLNLDYTSPDFVMDHSLTSSADMFSLGLLCVALYNSPHKSPLDTNGSVSAYKRIFASSSSVPSSNNNYLSSRPVPREMASQVLPRLITRRPAQRMNAIEFQSSELFNNIMVSTIRFLDTFPAKTPGEKQQFLRGLNKVLPSFPKSIMEKKILPALLEELKDRELLSLILQNIFKIINLLPSARRAFGEKVRPALKEIFVTNNKQVEEKDAARDAGLMVFLENLSAAAENCSGREFKDDMLPVLVAAFQCPTPSLVDAAMRSLPVVLPVLDFSTIKNELFPVIAHVFSKTSSLAIKIRGLQAFVILCGGSSEAAADDGLNGLMSNNKKSSSSSALDKYTMQEKIVPLIRAIKTKEPAVMIAALNVLRIVGEAADADFVAMDVLPILWSMSLGPLLNLKQFQTFMELIRNLSKRVEEEQTRKLQELAGSQNGATTASANEDFLSFGGVTGTAFDAPNGATEDDFEALVKGRASTSGVASPGFPGWDAQPSPMAGGGPAVAGSRSSTPSAPAFSWSTPPPTSPAAQKVPQQSSFRTVTPDLNSFQTLQPSATQYSQPLKPMGSGVMSPSTQTQTHTHTHTHTQSPSVNWGASASSSANAWGSSSPLTGGANYASFSQPSQGSGLSGGMSGMSLGQQRPQLGKSASSSFSLAPPPGSGTPSASSSFSIAPPPQPSQGQGSGGWGAGSSSAGQNTGMGMMGSTSGNMMIGSFGQQQQQQQQASSSKSGLDKYQSLI